MNTAVKSLLCLGSVSLVQSAVSPTRTNGNTRFPKFSAQVDATAAVDANSGLVANDLTTDQIKEDAAKNAAGTVAGLYSLFRFDAVYVYPIQNIGTQASTDAGVKAPGAMSVLTAGTKTFYQTDAPAAANDMQWATLVTMTTLTTDAGLVAAGAPGAGQRWGACKQAKMTGSSGAQTIHCSSVISGMRKSASGSLAADFQYTGSIPGRIFMGAYVSAVADIDVGHADITQTYRNAKPVGVNPDLVMGSFYQINGAAILGATWCVVGTSGNTSAQQIAFSTEVASAATEVLKANKGLGPRSKCTWQVTAAANTAAPTFQLDTMVSNNLSFQVIEWYDTANLGSNGIIPTATANVVGTSGNSPMAADASQYLPANGVFFNPIENVGTITTGTLAGASAWNENTMNSQANAVENQAGSIGTAMYYDRVTGQAKDTVKTVDSSWVLKVQEPYLAVKTGYDTAKSTYDTDKTAYETAFTANAKDGKTTVPTRPDNPTVPAAYSGATLELTNQSGSSPDSWTSATAPGFKAKTGTEMVLATGGTMAAPTYAQANIATHFHNRASYYQVSAATGTAFATATNEVAAAWGRLGQSATMDNTNGTPFFWGTPAAAGTQKPGMQISLLPEVTPSQSLTVADFTDVSGNCATISVKTATFASISTYDVPSTPTAATAISVGAQALAASMVAAAAVAATMF